MKRAKGERGADKVARIPVRVEPGAVMRKPAWIRVRAAAGPGVTRVRRLLREHQLHTVCEEAACPNLGECFHHGTATFMILGGVCTRRCPFCDVAHGRPDPPDPAEPEQIATSVATLGLRYVVVTSVDRDDLRDGGAAHFAAVIRALRNLPTAPQIEILTPDFRGRMERAVEALAASPPDLFNHNLETVPRLYPSVRPGADYRGSLALLAKIGQRLPQLPTKSGLMLGLGERSEEIEEVMVDLRESGCSSLTLGQYLQPGPHHLPVARWVHPDEFAALKERAYGLGFVAVASGPLVRSSYQADRYATVFDQQQEGL